ncbi:S-adenosyl-L-methionine-dependent methyltransferase [Tricholoma matsutake]|nr:S-adenosyl-L-methionine-dependent methyltransferase [Tricholoma matsutake 945]
MDSDWLDTDSDAESVVSLPPFSPAPSVDSYTTSYDASMRSGSPAPSVWSITSSILSQAVRQEFGRGVNNYSEVYGLAADDEELHRLEQQHEMFKEVMGDPYPPPMHEIMADDVPGESKACLDLGCGSGSWILDVAHDFPHCSAVAVDLIPMQSPSMPQNCRSEVDDINLGLEHFYGDFNVVHARLISSGIKDYAALIDQVSRVLRPGGMILMVEWDFHGYDGNRNQIQAGTDQLSSPWFPRWLAFARVSVRNAGGTVDAASNIKSWVTNHPAFEDVVCQDYWMPVSPWVHGDEAQMRIGETMRGDILAFLRSGRPLLLRGGVPEAVVDELQRNAEREMMEASLPQYIRLQSLYARKKQN